MPQPRTRRLPATAAGRRQRSRRVAPPRALPAAGGVAARAPTAALASPHAQPVAAKRRRHSLYATLRPSQPHLDRATQARLALPPLPSTNSRTWTASRRRRASYSAAVRWSRSCGPAASTRGRGGAGGASSSGLVSLGPASSPTAAAAAAAASACEGGGGGGQSLARCAATICAERLLMRGMNVASASAAASAVIGEAPRAGPPPPASRAYLCARPYRLGPPPMSSRTRARREQNPSRDTRARRGRLRGWRAASAAVSAAAVAAAASARAPSSARSTRAARTGSRTPAAAKGRGVWERSLPPSGDPSGPQRGVAAHLRPSTRTRRGRAPALADRAPRRPRARPRPRRGARGRRP